MAARTAFSVTRRLVIETWIRRQPIPKDALFWIASMSKPITAMGIMLLVDDGKLSVDDPVEKHLPEFGGQMLAGKDGLKKPSRPITVRDLLTHMSGLPDRTAYQAELYAKRNHSLADAIKVLRKGAAEFEPGAP